MGIYTSTGSTTAPFCIVKKDLVVILLKHLKNKCTEKLQCMSKEDLENFAC